MIRPHIVISHAAFSEERKATLLRMLPYLDGLSYTVHEDHEGKGVLVPWLLAMRNALEVDCTHVVWLPDDAILSVGFADALRRAIGAKPDRVLCFFSNHDGARDAFEAGCSWYTTPDGFVGAAGTFPKALLREFLDWYDASMLAPGKDERSHRWGANNDEAVNLWAISTGRLIYKALPSLVDGDLAVKSLEGHDHQNTDKSVHRTAVVFAPDARVIGFEGPIRHLGRTYRYNHWSVLTKLKSAAWQLERAYRVERQGVTVSKTPHVVIATPAYQPPELAYLESKDHVVRDLMDHGVGVTHLLSSGDSLVQRGRHSLMHQFLCTPGTHLLFWDADIECLTPDAPRHMVASGHELVGGAYPFRDGSGGVVCNPSKDMREHKRVDVDEFGCMPVSEVGTGFMMIRRDAIIRMCQERPDTLYVADTKAFVHTPMFALFDCAIRDRRYLSEDWLFCQRHGNPQVYIHAEFRHWGKAAHEGHITKAWGLEVDEPAEEAAE